ncbi:unnamed protein product, partial [Mesorhabditis belari]|uniref:Uncharacterized protein n=1 Tax=Mesorhabditis belari TaxID=2138241 RepID=A0AAF3J958_9BILA
MVHSRKFPGYQNAFYQISKPSTSKFESSATRKNQLIRWTSVELNELNESQREVPRVNVMLKTTTFPNDSQPSTKRISVDEMNLWMDSLPDPPTFPIDRLKMFKEGLISDFNQRKMNVQKRVLRIPQIPNDQRQEIEFSSKVTRILPQTFHPVRSETIAKRFTELNRINTTKRIPVQFGNDRCTDL